MKRKQVSWHALIIWLVWLHLLMTGQLHADGIKSIDIFSVPRPDQPGAGWKGENGIPSVQYETRHSGGARFSCLFRDSKLTRVFWDRQIALDLRDYAILELDVSCACPEAIRTLGLYLKSGDGWYLWITTLKGAGRPAYNPETSGGRQKLIFRIKDAATEGKPAGWNKISAVRLSFTRASDADTAVVAYSLRARSCKIAVVEGTVSAPDPAEKKTARSTALRLSRWLNDLGVSHAVIDDEDVMAGKLWEANIAILPYNSLPPRQEMAELSAFVKRGGKLIVFYSAEAGLAKLMHMKLGRYQAAEVPGQWSGFKFGQGAPDHLPSAVYQESNNIWPVYPDADDAGVIAYWTNAKGVALSDPAWVRSNRGFWMSHILLNGDVENKKRMLLGLLGSCDSVVWKMAADRAIRSSGNVGPYQGLTDAVSGIRRRARGSSQESIVKRLLARAARQFDIMCDASAQQRYQDVIESGRVLETFLIEAYSRAQRPMSPEFRGVWNHSGMGLYPGDWGKTCRVLSECGMTAVFPNLLWAGTAHYPSDIVPRSFIYKVYGDQLKLCADAARQYGLEIHVWKVCWNLGNAPAAWVKRLEKKGLLQQTDKGHTLNWLCPSHPDNIAFELNAISEVVTRYKIDGIHLDYVRYPSVHACYGPNCKKRFEQWLGRPVRSWPDSVKKGELRNAFISWRKDQITGFVRTVRKAVLKINPDVKISAAVYSTYPECASSIGQDWASWLKEGTVDFVCPMDYESNSASFRSIVQRQMALPEAKDRIYPGIGVTASESQLSPDQVIVQIQAARASGARGFILFDLNRTLETEVLPMLRLGVTRK